MSKIVALSYYFPLDALACLRQYPHLFRRSLESENRFCMGSFMSAEYDDLPEAVKTEVQHFPDINVVWLASRLQEAGVTVAEQSLARARAIFAAVAGAQLMPAAVLTLRCLIN